MTIIQCFKNLNIHFLLITSVYCQADRWQEHLCSGLHANEMRALTKHPEVSFSYYFVIVFCVFRLLFTNKDTWDAYYKEHAILDICWRDFTEVSSTYVQDWTYGCNNKLPSGWENHPLGGLLLHPIQIRDCKKKRHFCTSVRAIDGRLNPYIERERKSLETDTNGPPCRCHAMWTIFGLFLFKPKNTHHELRYTERSKRRVCVCRVLYPDRVLLQWGTACPQAPSWSR